ncbi:putative minor capsid protein [Eel River basin pequenovirus]|nr:putative minor capsid protein [Eel River basin pequenovirus]
MLNFLGPLAGAAVSSFFGNRAAKRSEKHANTMFDRNAALQREFAQSGIQWKVADAKKAGIHPLVALGASTHSAAPVALGADHSGIAQSGQDISRAIQTAANAPSKRRQLYMEKVAALDLRNRELQNDLLASQIAKNTQAGQIPRTGIADGPMLVDGQPDAGGLPLPGGRILTRPMRREASHSERKYQEAGAVTDLGYTRTKDGYAPVMSRNAKERLDDDLIGTLWWNMRNRILPMLGSNARPPPVPAGKGWRWAFDPKRGIYRRYRRKKGRMYGVPGYIRR